MPTDSQKKKSGHTWSRLSVKISLALAIVGFLCAMGLARLAFTLCNLVVLVTLGQLILKSLINTRLFKPLEGTPSIWRLWWWWEKRRIPANVLGFITIVVLEALVFSSEDRQPEKITCGNGLLAAVVGIAVVLPIFLNALYFLNPILDFASLRFKKKLISPLLMRYGFNIWLAVTALASASILASWQSHLLMPKP